MTIRNHNASLFAFALLFLPIAATAGDATQCVRVEGKQLVNLCGYPISVVWCTEDPSNDSNCNRGFDLQSNIAPGGHTSASPLSTPGQRISVRFAACMGANSAAAHGFEHTCDR